MVCPIKCSILDKRWVPPKKTYYIWSKAKMCQPRDHIFTPKYLCISDPFKPSYACPCKANPCSRYARVWAAEVRTFRRQQEMRKKLEPPPPKDRFRMKKFQNVPKRVDNSKPVAPKVPRVVLPAANPRGCCRCPGCCGPIRLY